MFHSSIDNVKHVILLILFQKHYSLISHKFFIGHVNTYNSLLRLFVSFKNFYNKQKTLQL